MEKEKIYKGNRNHRMAARLSDEEHAKFMSVPGKGDTEKVVYLIYFFAEFKTLDEVADC